MRSPIGDGARALTGEAAGTASVCDRLARRGVAGSICVSARIGIAPDAPGSPADGPPGRANAPPRLRRLIMPAALSSVVAVGVAAIFDPAAQVLLRRRACAAAGSAAGSGPSSSSTAAAYAPGASLPTDMGDFGPAPFWKK